MGPWQDMTNNKGFFVRVFLGEVWGGRIRGGGCVREGGFHCRVLCWFWAEGAEVLGRYVCSTRASLFLPFLIKFLEASLEFCLLLELVFPDLDFFGNTSPAASSYSPDHCCQCGLLGHTQDKCTHAEVMKHKKVDSSMQQVCHFCFAPGHVKSVCRKYTKHREDQKKALPDGPGLLPYPSLSVSPLFSLLLP